MRVVLLGSGTSTGVPVVGCTCPVCRSGHPGNERTRASAWLRWVSDDGVERSVVLDTGPDFRQQALREGIERLDAVLFTHAHADHILGLDDVRPYNFRQKKALDCFGSDATLAQVRSTFAYAFDGPGEGGGVPQIALREIDGAFDLFDRRVVPVPVLHGSREVLGFRLGGFAYVTDVSRIPPASLDLLGGLEVLILGALRYRPHPTHQSIEEALGLLETLAPGQAYLTHLAHDVDAARLEIDLPRSVALGYDGLSFQIG